MNLKSRKNKLPILIRISTYHSKTIKIQLNLHIEIKQKQNNHGNKGMLYFILLYCYVPGIKTQRHVKN